MKKIVLTPAELRTFQREVRGKGGFQVLLRKLNGQIQGNVLSASDDDLEKLARYSLKYGPGGFQDRTKTSLK